MRLLHSSAMAGNTRRQITGGGRSSAHFPTFNDVVAFVSNQPPVPSISSTIASSVFSVLARAHPNRLRRWASERAKCDFPVLHETLGTGECVRIPFTQTQGAACWFLLPSSEGVNEDTNFNDNFYDPITETVEGDDEAASSEQNRFFFSNHFLK